MKQPLVLQLAPPSCDPILRWTVTELWDDYVSRTQELMAGALSKTAMDARINELEALIDSEVANDPFKDYDFWVNNDPGFLRYMAEQKSLSSRAKFRTRKFRIR